MFKPLNDTENTTACSISDNYDFGGNQYIVLFLYTIIRIDWIEEGKNKYGLCQETIGMDYINIIDDDIFSHIFTRNDAIN